MSVLAQGLQVDPALYSAAGAASVLEVKREAVTFYNTGFAIHNSSKMLLTLFIKIPAC